MARMERKFAKCIRNQRRVRPIGVIRAIRGWSLVDCTIEIVSGIVYRSVPWTMHCALLQ
jgi:hypothetical protein